MENDEKKYVFIVEGNSDEDKLKKLNVTYVLKTGGKFIRPEIIRFIKEVHKNRTIVLLTDPDGPGKEIASKIESKVGKCIQVKADKKKAIYHDKVGIAEMKLEDLKNLIGDLIKHDENITEETVCENDLIDLGMIGPNGKKRRMKLIEKYHMPFTSGKNVLTAINMLSLTKEEIKEVIEND